MTILAFGSGTHITKGQAVVSVVLIIGLFNLALGFGLAVAFERQIVIPIPHIALRGPRHAHVAETPMEPQCSIQPVLDRELEAELVPDTWLQVLDGNDLKIVVLLDTPIRMICTNITAYRDVIAQTEDVLHSVMDNASEAACTGVLSELVSQTEQWTRHLTEAKETIEAQRGKLADYQHVVERLLSVIARQAGSLLQKSQTVASRWEQSQRDGAIRVLNEIAASLYRLRDIVMETLVIIMREENRLDVFDRRQHYDILTHLHNRLGVELVFRNWRREEVNSQRALSVALLDVDRFFDVNRLMSTRTGDRVLGVFGRLLDSLLANDFGLYHVFRLSGQQFLAFFADTAVNDAAALVEEIRHGIESTRFTVEERTLTLTLTACVTEVPSDETTCDLFGRLAGLCELAKQTGQNRVYLGHDSELELVTPTEQPMECCEIRVV